MTTPMSEKFLEFDKKGIKFANIDSKIDFDNPQVIKELKTSNPSLLLYYYRNNGMKNEAIELLSNLRKSDKCIGVIEEIISTYIFFGDHDGALQYLKHYELTNSDVRYLEYSIKIHMKQFSDSSDDLFNLVKEGLLCKYDISYIKILIDFYKRNCDGCFLSCIKEKLNELCDILTEDVLLTLKYGEVKYLYKKMPVKNIFLEQMVRMNPYIHKKYYIEYAKINGICKEDIVRILSVTYRGWAMKIAVENGWVDESMRIIVEKHFGIDPIFLNSEGSWERLKDGRGISFLRKDIFYEEESAEVE